MNTLFDFVSHVNGVMYAMALLFLAGLVMYWEVFSQKPFSKVISEARADLAEARSMPAEHRKGLIRNTVSGAAIMGMYLAALPVLFVQGMGSALLDSVEGIGSAQWSPVRAYFAGRKKAVKNESKEPARD